MGRIRVKAVGRERMSMEIGEELNGRYVVEEWMSI